MMPKAYAQSRDCANSGSAVLGIKNPGTGSISSLIADRLRQLFPVKTWASVAELLLTTERVSKHRLATSRDFTVDELARLLRSEHGFEILVDLIGDARPRWWRLCAPLMQAAEARKLQHAAQVKIRRVVQGALDADEAIDATITRAEAALAFQDADFRSPHVDALRAIRGASARALAAPAGKVRR